MAKSIFTFLLIVLSYTQLCYGTENVLSDSVKRYVSVEQIVLCEEGIVIDLEEGFVLSPCIFYDEIGFYFLETGARWVCGNCGAFNDLDNSVCYRCGE